MRSHSLRLVEGHSLLGLVKDFLDFCRAKNLSPNTITFYEGRLNAFVHFCSKASDLPHPEAVTAADIRSFVRSLMDAGFSTKTVNHNIQAVKTFFSYLVDEDIITSSPVERVKHQKHERTLIQTFSDEQVSAMLDTCDLRTFLGLRNYTMILTMLDTGLRVSELCGLCLEDIDLTDRTVKVMGKGRKERLVPFGSRLGKTLQQYLARRGDVDNEPHVFLTQFAGQLDRCVTRVILQKIGQAAKVTGVRVSPHTLRHTFAKNWILNGGDPFSLQRILGHTTQQMVSQYVNLATGDLQAQHAKFSPADRLASAPKRKKVLLR